MYEVAARADLQQFYGIDLDHAKRGDHTPLHIAALMEKLPPKSRVLYEINHDSYWELNDILAATMINHFRMFMWSMGGGKGAKPDNIGASFMKRESPARKLDAMVMPIDELIAELSKPRKGVS